MHKANFILTDIMKTGNHQSLEGFIKFNTLTNERIDVEGEYYTLHNYKLESYDRKLAILDVRIENIRLNVDHFYIELGRRLEKLSKQGFKFIYATPWESKANFDEQKNKFIPQPDPNVYTGYHWFGGVSWFWYFMIMKHITRRYDLKHNEKKYDFLYLNKVPRQHRKDLYKHLKSKNLIDNSLTSFTKHPTNPHDLDKDYELPFLKRTEFYPAYGMDQEVYAKPYEATMASIVSETNVNNTDVFITEKLWKAVLMEHVFVVHGNQHYLKTIQGMGFKTFSNIIDESYDNEPDQQKRIEKLTKTIEDLKRKDWKEIYQQTDSIRKHNKQHFYNKKSFSEQVNKEMLSWFKFFDSSQVSSTKS